MGRVKNWLKKTFGRRKDEHAKSYSVQLLVGDDGFMVAQSFNGGDLYTVYTQAIWTYICASRISQDISNIPAIVQTRDRGGAWKTDLDHELNETLYRPYGTSPFAPRWNWAQTLATGVLRQELSGNQFWQIVSSGGRLLSLGLYLVDIEAQTDQNTGLFTEYRVVPTSALIPADRMVNIMHANPCSFWQGVSPTVANEQATRVDYAASRRMRYDMETRVQAGLTFKVKSLFTMNSEQKEAALTMLEDTYQGAVNAGKSLVVGDNVEIEKPPIADAGDIPKMAEVARDSVISSFDVAPPMVGVLRDAKYVNWSESKRAHFNLCILPRLNNVYGTFNGQCIRPLYGPNVRLWYDLVQSPLGLEPLVERGEAARVYYDMGWPAMQLNDRFDLNMPAFDGWDQPHMSAVIAGRDAPGSEAAEDDMQDPLGDEESDDAVEDE
jgi:phage portal protein BeeE